MKKVYISQFTKCSCGHEMGSHRMWDPPAACRVKGCECEGFFQTHRDESITMVPLVRS
jgi:hypothetical protein